MFELIKQDSLTKARLGIFRSAQGEFTTPAFFPVATQGAVKGISPRQLKEIGTDGLLTNAYHLYLRPGAELIKRSGGLHAFMNFDKTIITDSGGYQIFSLARLRKVEDRGVTFQSHVDGKTIFLSPEAVIRTQLDLGSDIVVPLDECLPYPADLSAIAKSVKRTLDWAEKSRDYFMLNHKKGVLFFGIIQGSTDFSLRQECLEGIVGLEVDGLCLGGLSVGEPCDLRYNILSFISENVPSRLLRYLMGSGKPPEIIEAVASGIDLFDCVVPTRFGRTGTAFTGKGELVVRNAPCAGELTPLDQECGCYVCRDFTRAYLRHLINVREMLGVQLVTYHNIYWYRNFIERIRKAIREDKFSQFKSEFLAEYAKNKPEQR